MQDMVYNNTHERENKMHGNMREMQKKPIKQITKAIRQNQGKQGFGFRTVESSS
jgi:hypothetical protein